MKVAVIGCGTMGSAFARHFAKGYKVILNDRDKAKAQALAKEIGASFQEKSQAAMQAADVILLAVKPKDLSKLASDTTSATFEGKVVISILAGVSLAVLEKNFPTALIVRAMPNLALICGQGVIGLAEEGSHLTEERKKVVETLLHGLGLLTWISEEKLESLTALCGSGIGFAFVILEAMIDGGVFLGFTAHDSRELVLKTFEGAIALLRETGKHPAELKLNVSSPGGTTIAGLKVMEEKGVRAGIVATLEACHAKALNI